MTRKYSSTSVQQLLDASIGAADTSIALDDTAAVTAILGGVTLAAGNVDQFTIVIDPDTASEEVIFVRGTSGNQLTGLLRGQAGTSATTHTAGATVKHVLTSNDLDFYTSGVDNSITASSTTTLTNKTINLSSNTLSGTTAQFNTALSDGNFATIAGTETLTNKTLTAPIISTISNTGTVTLPTSTDTLVGRATTDTLTNKTLTAPTINFNQSAANYPTFKSPQEITTVSATAATGTINFDAVTQGILYYTSDASANWTVNLRGDGSTTLSSLMDVGDSITVVFMVTNGSTAYYNSAVQIDGSSVTPKWSGGTAPTAGNASSIDIYTYTVIKTAATPTYTVFASVAKFA